MQNLLPLLFSIGSFSICICQINLLHFEFHAKQLFCLSESTFCNEATLHAVRLLYNEATDPTISPSDCSSSCKYREPPLFLREISQGSCPEGYWQRGLLWKAVFTPKVIYNPYVIFEMRTNRETMPLLHGENISIQYISISIESLFQLSTQILYRMNIETLQCSSGWKCLLIQQMSF